MKRAVIYIRKRGRSPDSAVPKQRQGCRQVAKKLGAEVVEEYVDIGKSARQMDRPGLVRLLFRLKAHADVDYVIVQRVDRLVRSTLDEARIRTFLDEVGARLASAFEPVEGVEFPAELVADTLSGRRTALNPTDPGEEQAA